MQVLLTRSVVTVEPTLIQSRAASFSSLGFRRFSLSLRATGAGVSRLSRWPGGVSARIDRGPLHGACSSDRSPGDGEVRESGRNADVAQW